MIHTHVHTKYSLRDSIIDYDDLINRLKSINQNAIAITDHGNIHASVSIYKRLKKENIKYIHGCEMYICDDTNIKDQNNKYYHLVLLCKNETGRINLNKLISISNLSENFYSKPRIDFEKLKQHKDGLLVLSACLAGEISKFLLIDDYEKAKEIALKYKNEFGNDYYLEIQARNDNKQIEINKKIIALAKELDISIVVTTDAHFVTKEDKKYHDVYSFNSSYKEEGEGYIDCYIQSEEEIRNNLVYLDSEIVNQAINNTHEIADKCNVELPLSAPIIPHIDIPSQYNNEKEWVIDICQKGFEERGINKLPEKERQVYYDRYQYELNAVEEMGFLGYYLLVYTYANKVKRRGIARGSGGGSLLCYLMNITDIDPIEHKLYFERFIDVGALDALREGKITRKELKVPDVDLDFGTHDREKIIQFLINKYGQQHVACIGRFNYNKSRGTLTDIGRALGIEFNEVKEITKSLEDYELNDVLDLIEINKNNPDKPNIVKKFEKYIKKYPDLFEISKKLIGLPSSFGLHPCGRVIVMQDLDYYTASCYHENGERYLQGDMHDIEDLGIVKIDALGLRTVDVIYDALELISKDYEYINPKKLDFSDEKVLDIFKNGDTVGIFQFESYGMQDTLRDMQPTGIEDLSVANALYRPGAMAYIKNYCNRKHGKEEITYLHKDLIPILSNTYGIMVFQEQLIEIGRLANLRNPDKLRKATGKKDEKLLIEVHEELKQNLLNKGWTEEQFNQLWSDMLQFAKYAFNKSHSSAYATIAFITAKLKAYHPLEFYVSLMNSYIEDSSQYIKNNATIIYEDIINHGYVMNKFDFRQNHKKCNIYNGKINYAIPLIKHCNRQIAEELYEIRNNQYNNFIELLYDINQKTSINSAQLDILVRLGFFNEFGNSRLLNGLVEYFNFFKQGSAKQISVDKIKDNQILDNIIKRHSRLSPFGKTYMDLNVKAILNDIEEWMKCNNVRDYPIKEKINTQKEYLGFVNLTTGKEEDKRKLLVLDVKPLISQKYNKIWAYAIDEISIGSGKKNRLTIWSNKYEKKPLQANDILYAYKVEKNDKGYWYLQDYDIINSEFS
jgi:DNA polymerase-3 subunit alpha